MTTLREAAKHALEVLEESCYPRASTKHFTRYDKAIEKLRETLEKPDPEPVAWMDREGDLYKMPEIEGWAPPHTLLYTAPPQRKPLTDQQKLDLVTNWFAEDWAIKKALGLLRDYDIGGKE